MKKVKRKTNIKGKKKNPYIFFPSKVYIMIFFSLINYNNKDSLEKLREILIPIPFNTYNLHFVNMFVFPYTRINTYEI